MRLRPNGSYMELETLKIPSEVIKTLGALISIIRKSRVVDEGLDFGHQDVFMDVLMILFCHRI